jgi:putative transcriptional regulator
MDIFGKDSGGLQEGYLTGQLLVAMPAMGDPRFAKTVIYMCVHNNEGAMGLVVNKLVDSFTFPELLDQLDIESLGVLPPTAIHYGGPVEAGRGFVLHSLDYQQEGTISIADGVGLTATIDVLRDIAENRGPLQSLLALGYAGWGAGQLDDEIHQNAWLNVPADQALIFDNLIDEKWERAIAKLGVDLRLLSGDAGHA